MKRHIDIHITGTVQGVFFRAWAKQKAQTLAIHGFVRNESDGSVLLEAEGEPNTLDEFITWCRKGPNTAKVEDLAVSEGAYKGYTNFSVR